MDLGNRIKIRRKQLKLTQKELASGICTQSQISKIEKNEIIPLSNLLIQIAERLEISLDYLVGHSSDDNQTRINIDYDRIDKLLKERKYKDIEILIDEYKSINLQYSDKIYIEYIQLICNYYNENIDPISNLETLLYQNINFLSQKLIINIYNSLAIFNMNNKGYDKAEYYFELAMSKIIFTTIDNNQSYKVIYNYMRMLNETKEFKKLYNLSLDAINTSFSNENIICLGEFLYFKIHSLISLNSIGLIEKDDLILAEILAKRKKNQILLDELKKLEELINDLN